MLNTINQTNKPPFFIKLYWYYLFLGLISDGLSKLKGLAIGLGGEIERQNEQIETKINPQMDKLNYNIDNQNTQMKKILRKWFICLVGSLKNKFDASDNF